jgi:hypothetical protein
MHNIKTGGADLAHCRIIRRNGAQLTAPAAGAPTLRAGPVAFAQPARALLRAILAPRAMVQALTCMLAFRRCSAPPGSLQEPPRPMVPPRWGWGSALAVRGVEGGAA